MLCFPNAKINLGLNIIEKRTDGFHNIETVFYPVQLCDVLESIKHQVPSIKTQENKIIFSNSGIAINDATENNLCVKAFELLDKDFNMPSIKMHLHKIIPMGAGLGGGSSDAAFTLKLLNELFDLKQNNEELKNYAQQLGSDCSFFMENVPMFASGRGENLEKINLSMKGYFILIAKPAMHVSTADAYSFVKPQRPERLLKEIIQSPIKKWKNILKNDFEKSVFEKFPVIAEIKNKMYEQGAVYSSMSGSGSAVYGIFEKKSFDKKDFENCLTFESVLS